MMIQSYETATNQKQIAQYLAAILIPSKKINTNARNPRAGPGNPAVSESIGVNPIPKLALPRLPGTHPFSGIRNLSQ